MAWSKLRARWRELLSPTVADRVDVHMAGYRKAYEQRGRAWLTVDGITVASFCEFSFENEWRAEGLRQGSGERGERPFTSSAECAIREAGLHDKSDLLDAMAVCIGNPINTLLKSPDNLVRALAMLDRRLGKRRLRALDVGKEDPLVARMYELRSEAEFSKSR